MKKSTLIITYYDKTVQCPKEKVLLTDKAQFLQHKMSGKRETRENSFREGYNHK